jgi:ribosomal 50S subunit-associated protein YjgA (DUF615 family)
LNDYVGVAEDLKPTWESSKIFEKLKKIPLFQELYESLNEDPKKNSKIAKQSEQIMKMLVSRC